ncbi:peroxisomal 2,4-dienoyl-CoA reductase isoform X2 [Apteryx rowi]|uniref:peroxisomal 2,4-dienoyl-CoA reductase isoform X2 n=1 Tax=Apteryx rowi TaxID=308060 RepID=UPI000E1DE148|nr:peroxisomal 2,4-dienoyl-CoA reductase isoform X2 [Apteryx rowi]
MEMRALGLACHVKWLPSAVSSSPYLKEALTSEQLSTSRELHEASKKLVAATGQRCLPLSLDVRQPQTIVAAVDEALKEFERIDILVNGAAGNFLCPASALSFNAFKTVMDIDTVGTFNTSKVLFEKCFRDHGGVIVNITATLSYRGQALQVHAGAAKAAVDAMTRHLAVEWGPNNIRVNSLAPGPITGTEGYRRLGGKFAEKARHFEMIPLHRAGNKTEIAHSVLYLASPLSSYVTGTTLVVDGGSWLTSANDFPALLGGAGSPTMLSPEQALTNMGSVSEFLWICCIVSEQLQLSRRRPSLPANPVHDPFSPSHVDDTHASNCLGSVLPHGAYKAVPPLWSQLMPFSHALRCEDWCTALLTAGTCCSCTCSMKAEPDPSCPSKGWVVVWYWL